LQSVGGDVVGGFGFGLGAITLCFIFLPPAWKGLVSEIEDGAGADLVWPTFGECFPSLGGVAVEVLLLCFGAGGVFGPFALPCLKYDEGLF
jgi:hypothetical protein